MKKKPKPDNTIETLVILVIAAIIMFAVFYNAGERVKKVVANVPVQLWPHDAQEFYRHAGDDGEGTYLQVDSKTAVKLPLKPFNPTHETVLDPAKQHHYIIHAENMDNRYNTELTNLRQENRRLKSALDLVTCQKAQAGGSKIVCGQ